MITYWVELSLADDLENGTENSSGTVVALLLASQYARAKNVVADDILLHYTNRIKCWSGYSIVSTPAEKISNPQNEWEKAYPYKIQIKPQVCLAQPEQLILTQTRLLPDLSHDNWHRKSYLRVSPNDAAIIMNAIDKAQESKGEVDADFLKKFRVLRDKNRSDLCKRKYRCELCKTSIELWCEKLGLEKDVSVDPGWFFHAHHIRHVSKGGDADLDNLLCLCPNCHQLVHTMSEDEVHVLRNRLK